MSDHEAILASWSNRVNTQCKCYITYLANYSLYLVIHTGLCLSLFILYGILYEHSDVYPDHFKANHGYQQQVKKTHFVQH